MSQSELVEHRGYLEDENEIAAYQAALTEVVKPGNIVLDLGAGTGLLGHLACEAGAKSVVAVERGDIIQAAVSLRKRQSMPTGSPTSMRSQTEVALAALADVVVCDQIGDVRARSWVRMCGGDAMLGGDEGPAVRSANPPIPTIPRIRPEARDRPGGSPAGGAAARVT